MSHIARVALLVLLVLPLEAKPFGSQAVGPAPGYPSVAKLASGAAGTIAVWRDSRAGESRLYAAILNSDGEPAVVHNLESRNRPAVDDFFVGADDAGFLIIWENYPGIFARRIAADGTVMPSVTLSVPGDAIQALASNGKVYAALVRDGVILLDRDARVISGALLLSGDLAWPIASGSRFLLSSGLRAAVVSESNFPPVGQTRQIQPQWTHLTRFTVAPAPPGWVIAWSEPGRLLVQRLNSRGSQIGPILQSEVTDPPGDFYHSLSVAASGADIVAQYVTTARNVAYVHFDAARNARKLEAPGPDRRFSTSQGTKDGVLASWLTWDYVLSAGRVASRVWDEGGALLAFSRRAQGGVVLGSGGGVILATWGEREGSTGRGFMAILAPDGELRTAPVALPPDTSRQGIAFGSGKFLLVYFAGPERDRTFGQFIGTDGSLLGDPFRIMEEYQHQILSAVTSDGVDFYVSSQYGIHRIRADGTMIDAEPYAPVHYPYLSGAALAWDGERFHSIFRETIVPCQPCGSSVMFGSQLLSRDLQPLRSAETLADTGVWTVGPKPVIAASNGKALALWDLDYSWLTTVTNKDGVVATHEHRGFQHTDLLRRPQVVAHGTGFVATIDPALLRFDENGELVAWTTIDPAARGSALVSTGDRILVLYERMEDVRRLEAVSLPLPEPKRRAVR